MFRNEIDVVPDEIQGVILTEAPFHPKPNREKIVQMMFETYFVQNLYLANEAVMSLFASGRSTGLVIESGEGMTYAQ